MLRKILLIAPPPLKLGEWVSDQSMIEESKKLGAEFKIAAEQFGIQFADSAEWNVDIAFDGVHFSEEGHKRFAEKIYEEIKLRGEV